MTLEIPFRLPLPGLPRALFRSDYGYDDARLEVDGARILRAASREELERGVEGRWSVDGPPIAMRLSSGDGVLRVHVVVDGQNAEREDRIWAAPTLSAWIHAFIALAGSGAGFLASYFYILKAESLHSDWAWKMGQHTAGWHLLLTLTLFPMSVWGQRIGIRSVQVVSFVFFAIHAAIAAANANLGDPWIAVFNALSGALFLAATVYGNRAYRDMDPVAALRAGRA